MYFYVVYGLSLRSDIPLPGLPAGGDGRDVSVQQGAFDPPQSLLEGDAFRTVVEPDIAYLRCPLGCFRVRAGGEIIAMPVPQTAPEFLARFISAHVLGILLYQRGVPALHASAVAVGAEAIAFVGDRAAGKSAVAAALLARGHPLVTDDLLPLRFSGAIVLAYPGVAAMKLWPDAARATGSDPDVMPMAWPGWEKRYHALEHAFVRDPLPLSRVYVLTHGDDHSVTPMAPAEAVFALARHSYDSAVLHTLDEERVYRQSISLFRSVGVYRLQRAAAIERLPELACVVEEHLSCEPTSRTVAPRPQPATERTRPCSRTFS